MLSDELKKQIQLAYRASLEAKSHKPRAGQREMIGAIARTLGNIKQGSEGERLDEKHVAVIEAKLCLIAWLQSLLRKLEALN
jgi:ATP-dependent DNA helicase DinG